MYPFPDPHISVELIPFPPRGCTGRSTLQNEIIGDLGKEFGSLPEAPEETSLSDLCAALQASFGGQLGKHSVHLLGRMVSSKMPGGFNMGAVRRHLESRWGLATGRQDAVLLLAVVQQPPARVGTEADAKSFLDAVVQAYIASTGLVLPGPGQAESRAGGTAEVNVSPEVLTHLRKDQQAFYRQMLEAYARQLGVDLHAADRLMLSSRQRADEFQAELDLWHNEHGEAYATGIKPMFSALKVRSYDSSWNWVLQDLLICIYGIITGRVDVTDDEFDNQRTLLLNRSSPRLLEAIQHLSEKYALDQGPRYQTVKQFLSQLAQDCQRSLTAAPVAKELTIPMAPRTITDQQGNVTYVEVPRGVSASTVKAFDAHPAGPVVSVRYVSGSSSSSEYGSADDSQLSDCDELLPVEDGTSLCLRRKGRTGWDRSKPLTNAYLKALDVGSVYGLSFQDKTVLVTGAGKGSIGARIVQGLISGGAKVIVTTSSYSRQVTQHYQGLYARYGARGSQLAVAPFNQGSQQDTEALVAYIYDAEKGLGWDLDHIIPFAAVSENGREIDNIDSKSELAHRVMLTNTLRLLGAVKRMKAVRRIRTRPAQVILPLSPNHGTFGNDGLYSESKLALESLFEKWWSESWSDYLSICGAVIGWTRGTGLMSGNDLLSDGIERLGVRTFSQREMAFNILGLMAAPVQALCQVEPLMADLSGGMGSIPHLKEFTSRLRQGISETSSLRRAIVEEQAIERRVVYGDKAAAAASAVKLPVVDRRANIRFDFPKLPDYKTEIEPLSGNLKGMVDLDKVVVVTGFSELGPYGNARTRWEMEASGEFSLEGCIEMAWIMGLIKNHDGPIKGKPYCGWVDAKSGEPIADRDVKRQYEQYILDHSGIRIVEPRASDGPDARAKQYLHEVIVQEDLQPFEASKETAYDFKRQHGDHVDVFEDPASGEFTVHIRKGATMMIPKAMKFSHAVAGQIPTGWNPRTYGIAEDIISQVDPVVLYVLVCTVEAFLSAGITDTYELYKHVHVSEIGNCVGSALGGMAALEKMFKDRYLDKPVQNDILSESFVNTAGAWVNMLLLSSAGPLMSPVGACATAVESLDVGCELITSGKAKVCLVGGFDDMLQAVANEFANMKATNHAENDMARGRDPKEMSRPAASSRSGFIESEGCGIQILTTASLALDMGLPIHGVVALTHIASDQLGRSVPAPGKGLVTIARESPSAFPAPFLNIKYRKAKLALRREQIREVRESDMVYLKEQLHALAKTDVPFDVDEFRQQRTRDIELEARKQEKEAWSTYGHQFWKHDDRISPLRGALAAWGLTIDDLNVASFHGTSTQLNEKNEFEVIQRQLAHLGRKKGNVLLGVCQKALTGHPKGAAGAWMMNGCLQMLNSGLVPGNRNADNIDEALAPFDYIVVPGQSIQTDGIKAFSLTSFGFGQKGAQAIGVHPRYLFATLEPEVYQNYRVKVAARQKRAYRAFHHGLVTNRMFVAKDRPPYEPEQGLAFLMDSSARVAAGRVS